MINPDYPNVLLYSADRNPLIDSAFDFSPPGMYLTQTCVPEDSMVNLAILLYNADSIFQTSLCYDSSCGTGPLKLQMYIDKFDVYPNPANNSITFAYTLLQAADVKLELYDNMGNLVSKIYSGKQDKGSYKIQYSTKDLKEGLYYGILWANTEYKTLGIIIMH